MEGFVLGSGLLNSTVAATGLLILLAVAMGAILFGYIADEEAKGRRIGWLEEPLAGPGEYRQAQGIELKKAA